MYGLWGKIVAQPGQRDALAALLLQAAGQMHSVAGCRAYLVSVEADDADAIGVYEVWDTQAQHDASLQVEAVRAVIAQARPLIAGFRDRQEFTPLGGLGIGKVE